MDEHETGHRGRRGGRGDGGGAGATPVGVRRDHPGRARPVRQLRQLRAAVLHLARHREALHLAAADTRGVRCALSRPRAGQQHGEGARSCGAPGPGGGPRGRGVAGVRSLDPRPGRLSDHAAAARQRRAPRLQAVDRARHGSAARLPRGAPPAHRRGGGRRLHRPGDGRGVPQARRGHHRGGAGADRDERDGPRARPHGAARAREQRRARARRGGRGGRARHGAPGRAHRRPSRGGGPGLVLGGRTARAHAGPRGRPGHRPLGRPAGGRAPPHLGPSHLRGRGHGGGGAQGLGSEGARAPGRARPTGKVAWRPPTRSGTPRVMAAPWAPAW
jgi:translation initiation factor IF-2